MPISIKPTIGGLPTNGTPTNGTPTTPPDGKLQAAAQQERLNKLKQGWEAYRDYLDQKGLYGDERLNHAFGKQVFINWAKKNPQYGLNWDTLPTVAAELSKQKKSTLEAVSAGKLYLDRKPEEMNPTEQANLKSKNPTWPGTLLTDQSFPTYTENFYKNGKLVQSKDYGTVSSDEKFDKIKTKEWANSTKMTNEQISKLQKTK